MKLVTIIILGLLILSFVVVGYYYIEIKEDKRLEEIYNRVDNSPEFMKNGEWFDIILNGYNGEK